MLNKVTFIGNLGKDPELRKLENGVSLATFSIATNEKWKDKDGNPQSSTEWHNIVCWRGLADMVEMYYKKGNLVYIEGKLTHRKYQDKDGNDRYMTEVVASTCRSLEKRDATQRDGDNASGGDSTPKSTNTSVPDGGDLPF